MTSTSGVARARLWFGVQAVGGAVWWITVWASPDVRRWTLGGWRASWIVGPDLVLFVGASAVAAAVGSRVSAALATGWTAIVTAGLIVYATFEHRAGWGAVLMVLSSVGSIAAVLTMWLGHLPREWITIGPFAFRSAADRTKASHLRHSLAQLVFFWSMFLIVIPLVLTWFETQWRLDWDGLDRAPWPTVGVVVFIVSSGLGLWACASMAWLGEGTPLPSAMARNLVVAGPYRIVRNPMAVAGALQTIGVGLWCGSWMVLAIAIAGAFVWHATIRPQEEADLATRFGADYEQYRRNVRCWVPTLVRG